LADDVSVLDDLFALLTTGRCDSLATFTLMRDSEDLEQRPVYATPCVFHHTPTVVPGPLAPLFGLVALGKATSLGCALHPLGLGG